MADQIRPLDDSANTGGLSAANPRWLLAIEQISAMTLSAEIDDVWLPDKQPSGSATHYSLMGLKLKNKSKLAPMALP